MHHSVKSKMEVRLKDNICGFSNDLFKSKW